MNSISRSIRGHFLFALAMTFVVSAWALAGNAPNKKPPPPDPNPPAANAWPKLGDDEQVVAVEQLKSFAGSVAQKLNRPLQSAETKFFLFYSDLRPQEAANWTGLLDRMYANLCQTFRLKKGENIWRGKALVFVFSRAEDYRNYEKTILHTDPGASAGMCHSFNDGTVKIAFFRQPEELDFAHVLVHESVHGFVHRYRSPVPVPSWANEGLAETIATDLVPRRGYRDFIKTAAREGLQQHNNSMSGFFDAEHIDGWQYPVAQTLCEFMIQAGRRNYVNFIIGIKDGMSWQDSLDTKYKAPMDRLVSIYGKWIGINSLTQ